MKSLAILSLVLCAVASPTSKSSSSTISHSSTSSISTSTSKASSSSTSGSSSSSTTQSSSTTSTTCSPTPTPNLTWRLADHKGLYWDYADFDGSAYDGGITVSLDQATGVKQCETACAPNPNCRSISYWVDTFVQSPGSPGVVTAYCDFWASPFNASFWHGNFTTIQDTINSTYVYEATNWSPPAKLLPNGNFERGCLAPWTASLNTRFSVDVLPCNKKVKGDCPAGSDHYLFLNGTGAVRTSNGEIVGEPVVTQNKNYRCTGYVQGAVGSDQQTLSIFYETMNDNDIPTFNGTGQWEKVDFTFIGTYGGALVITPNATPRPGLVDWKITGMKVEKIG